MKKNIVLSFIIFSLSLFVISCASDDGDNVNPITPHDNGPLKLVILNNTEYDVKEVYYSQEAPYYNNYGTKINTDILKDQESINLCPREGNYYFTFIRQNGSSSNDLYISSGKALSLKAKAGTFTVKLFPYNFYYEVEHNDELICGGDNSNGE